MNIIYGNLRGICGNLCSTKTITKIAIWVIINHEWALIFTNKQVAIALAVGNAECFHPEASTSKARVHS